MKIHLKYPFQGSRGTRNELWNKGCNVARGRTRTLMRKMGIEAIYKKPRLSEPHPDHTIYPYLLRGLSITEANPVWTSDITYIPMAKGFCYLVAVMDWASRKVLSWSLSKQSSGERDYETEHISTHLVSNCYSFFHLVTPCR